MSLLNVEQGEDDPTEVGCRFVDELGPVEAAVEAPAAWNVARAERDHDVGRRLGCAHKVPRESSAAMWSAWRMANATIVSVGFAAAPVVITEPSLTNMLGTSCAWPHSFSTPSAGSALIRQVPRLCVEGYGGV